ncbi:putative polysaccharide export protein [Diplodia seriata]|uniref:Putative polysaccharide export protein n=1 Tax=Diplodia seriata TaxID=420778 RepID=A0A0G2DXM3_9PEZI|nr:putative polysaccharide export protein [Diplodia seriata]
MLPRRYTRISRLPRTLLFDLLPVLLLFYSLVEVLSVRRALQAVDQTAEHEAETYEKGEKIFISSIHLHDEQLLRAHWNDALLSLVEALGPSNVYVSIYESNSRDDTKGALRDLDAELEHAGVRTTVVLDPSTREQELEGDKHAEGWITTPAGEQEKRRIPYLARLRNRTLKPLEELESKGERFDRVLFLNDVVFNARDILALLRTNAGHYAAACALDFRHAPAFYDTFATRDLDGHAPLSTRFPYFRAASSRHALTHRGHDHSTHSSSSDAEGTGVLADGAVPVASCWNGALAMDAAPFYTKLRRLAFRALPDGLAAAHLEASECCLVHADNPYSPGRGVFVNPGVRVGYTAEAYAAVNPGDGRLWLSAWDIFYGMWENRALRLMAWGLDREEVVVGTRVGLWEKDFRRTEPGAFCAVDEMQVLRNDGWAHV